MAGNIRWEGDPGAFNAYLSTALNSLANDAIDTSGAEINNETQNYDDTLDIELGLASVDLSAQTNPSVVIYISRSGDDGTTFEDSTDAATADGSMPPSDQILTIIGLRPFTGAETKYRIKEGIPIGPGRFKLFLRNKTGAGFPASGNTLKYRTYQRGYT